MLDLEVDWSDDAVGAGQSLPDWTTHLYPLGRWADDFNVRFCHLHIWAVVQDQGIFFFFSVKFFLYFFLKMT